MTREEAINEIKSWAIPSKNGREVLETLIPELRENEDENLKNKSGYYKAGKFWKASTLWNATKNKVPQRVPNRYILQECTWNIGTLQRFADEVKNVQEVSLDYPIILDMNGNIIDGAHRVVKAYLEGKDIDIVYIGDDEWPEPDYDEEKAVKESKDEKIRKSLIKFLTDIKEISESGRTSWAVRKEDAEMCKSFLAYLEKQKEQKPVECIEFDNEFEKQVSHLLASVLNGEWEYDEGFVKHAAQSLLGYAKNELKSNYCLYGGYPSVGRCRWCSAYCSARLTDVHTDDEKEYIRTIKSIISDFIRDKKPENLAYYQRIYDWLDGRHVPFSCGHEKGQPADPVFSKQEYESHPIISTDTTSVKPRELDGKTLLYTADKSYQIGFRDGVASVKPEWSEGDEEMMADIIDSLEYAYPYDNEFRISWLKSLRPQSKQEWSEDIIRKAVKEVGLTQHQINWLETNVFPPKQEWSEEDEKTINDACCWIAEYAGYLMDKNYGKASMLMGLTDKLKSLRPQSKKELSIEKAIQWLDDTFYFLDNSSGRGRDCEITTHDFDSLEEMYDSFRKAVTVDSESHWKPSEEQIYSLGTVVNGYDNCTVGSVGYNLKELYEQLKKLM